MSLETLRTRMQYIGGTNQQDRMNLDKLRTLKRSLLYSYQAATAILEDGREFRCLINPDKLKEDYDDKIISIPFEDICLNKPKAGKTSEGIEPIGMKAGDVFTWKENGTYWIVYLQRFQETAYFRAEIKLCRYEVKINDNIYKIYFRGPQVTSIDWNSKSGTVWNNLNYDARVIITNNEETNAFFHRFTKVKINGKNWEVQAVDTYSTEGILDVYLKEDYTNSIADAVAEEIQPEPIPIDPESPHIEGNSIVHPFDLQSYEIKNVENGQWFIDNNKIIILTQSDSLIDIEINTAKSGNFNIYYKREDEEDIILPVKIESL